MDEVDTFCKELSLLHKDEFKCVVKPNESAGTDSVFLCVTPEEVKKAYKTIHNHSNGLGHNNDGALCQEFLSGTEFVIDGVSRDGVYKVRTCVRVILIYLMYYYQVVSLFTFLSAFQFFYNFI